MVTEVRWFAAIDWSHDDNQVCVLDSEGEVAAEFAVSRTGSGLSELRRRLLELGKDPQLVWIGIETSHGPVVEMLVESGFVVFSINPKQASRFRERYEVSGAKDDEKDAFTMARALRTDTSAFRRLKREVALCLEVRELSRSLEELRQDRQRIANRIWDLLQRYYPQMNEVFGDATKPSFLRVWQAVPTPEAAKKMSIDEARRLLRAARIRRETPESLVEKLSAEPLPVSGETCRALVKRVEIAVRQIELLNGQEREIEKQLEAVLDGCPDDAADGAPSAHSIRVLRSIPGVRVYVVSCLIGEAWGVLSTGDIAHLRLIGGVAPVTRKTGKRRDPQVLMRMSCQHRLREALFHMARVAMQTDEHWKAVYSKQRARGKSYGRAIRGLGDRMLRVLVSMLNSGTEYDPSRIRAVA
jgi:hypothetical protein